MNYKLLIGLGIGIIIDALGGWDIMLKALIFLVCLDYATGVLAAIYKRKLSSAIGYKGIIKKVSIFAVVALAVTIDKCFGSDTVHTITTGFYIANEGISILENVGKTGVKYPPKLKKILEQLKDDNKDGGKK